MYRFVYRLMILRFSVRPLLPSSSSPLPLRPSLHLNLFPHPRKSLTKTLTGNPGLTPDFYSIFNASDRMNIIELSNLARKSISYSMMNDLEQSVALRAFDDDWEKWLDLIIASEKRKGVLN